MFVLGLDPGATCGLALIELRGGRAIWLADETTRDPFDCLLIREDLARVDLLAVEHVETVYPRARFNAHMASGLARANAQAARLVGRAEALGICVEQVSAAQWRAKIVGKASPTDAEIALVIRSRIEDWPARSNAHARDAAGVALFAGLRKQMDEATVRRAGATLKNPGCGLRLVAHGWRPR